MTSDRDTLRFIVEELADVPLTNPEEIPPDHAAELLERAAVLLVGKQSLGRLQVRGIGPKNFYLFRRNLARWLGRFVSNPSLTAPIKLGPLTMTLAPVRRGDPALLGFEGDGTDLLWLAVIRLVAKVGVGGVGVCPAPKPRRFFARATDEDEPEPCDRLFIRPGKAKKFCSEQCRARVATQRARKTGRKADAKKKARRRKKTM